MARRKRSATRLSPAAAQSQRKARKGLAPSGVLSTTEMEELQSGRRPIPGRDWLTVMHEGHPEQEHPLQIANDADPDEN